MEQKIINKVAGSGIETIDLESFIPKEEIVVFDLKNYLFRELILKEKDFREALKSLDFSIYKNKIVSIYCSTDAIIPVWAFMLVAGYLQPICKAIYFGTKTETLTRIILEEINSINIEDYRLKRVVIKGCGDIEIPASAYVEITKILKPLVKSLMYGEPCSTVPIFKNNI